jgi:hypothetical protein
MTEISLKIDQWLDLKQTKRQIILKRQSNVAKKKILKYPKNNLFVGFLIGVTILVQSVILKFQKV